MKGSENLNTTLQVHVTNQCNLRCPYCYIDFNKRSMTLDDFKAQLPIARKLAKLMNPDGEKFNIAYFGGEPLLNIDVVFQINDYLRSIDFPIGFSHIQTNSLLLTPEILAGVNARGVGMSYSFDGLTDTRENIVVHEQQLASGLIGTSAKIMVSGDTIDQLNDNYEYFLNLGFKDPDFSFVRDDVWTEESLKIAADVVPALVDRLIDLTLTTGELHLVGFVKLNILDSFVNTVYGRRDFTCFAGRNGFALTPDRVIYPCSRFYANDEFRLADANLDVIYKDVVEELRRKLSTKTAHECGSCKLKKYCNTGCAYSQLINGDRQRLKPISGYCKLLEITYAESMRLYRELRETPQLKNFINEKAGEIYGKTVQH